MGKTITRSNDGQDAGTMYVHDKDRYVVTFRIGYQDNPQDGASSMEEAAGLATHIVAEGGYCTVEDRLTGETRSFAPDEFWQHVSFKLEQKK